MPRKKTYSKTRRANKLRRFRYGRRKLAYPRSLGSASVNKHNFIRWEATDRKLIMDSNITGEWTQGYEFSLNQLVNYTDFTNLYDQYKIKWVKLIIDWAPRDNMATSASTFIASGVANPIMYFKRDYDDSTAGTIDALKQSNQTKALRITPYRSIKIFMRPACLQSVYEGFAGAVGYAPKWRQRLDCADAAVPHYGIKMGVQGLPSVNLGALNIRVQYGITCYNTR